MSATASSPTATTAPSPSARVPAAVETAGPIGNVRITLAGLTIQVQEQLEFFNFEGEPLGESTIVPPDQPVEVRRPFTPGSLAVAMDGTPCFGSVEVIADHEADVLAWIDWFEEPRCVLQTIGVHPVTEAHAGAIGQLIVEAQPGADVRIEALDVPGTQPLKGPPDGGGYLIFAELPRGWYEVSLRDKDNVTFRTPVEIGADDIGQVDMVIPPPAVPLKCVSIEQRPCEAAMLEAWSFGMFPRTREIGELSGVTVAPSEPDECMSEPGNTNILDVTFERPGKAPQVIPLTRSPRGFLHVCPAY